MPFEDDLWHLTAAQGYLELGIPVEANEEFEQIDPDVRHVPEVMAVQVLEKPELLEAVATKLRAYDPDEPQWMISVAYATRRVESIPAAKIILEEALFRHPKIGVIHFNLACYECQLENLEKAKEYLSNAVMLESVWRKKAMEDQDLEPLWA
jgi:tetratricopeptide (TPR) repeat protein